jgi:hypothetical protein
MLTGYIFHGDLTLVIGINLYWPFGQAGNIEKEALRQS